MAQESHRNVAPKKNNLTDVLSLLKAGSCSYHLVQDFFQHYCMPSLNDPMSFLYRMDDPIRQSRSETDDKPVLRQSQQLQVCATKTLKTEQVCVWNRLQSQNLELRTWVIQTIWFDSIWPHLTPCGVEFFLPARKTRTTKVKLPVLMLRPRMSLGSQLFFCVFERGEKWHERGLHQVS